mmetsp:Transcript_18657/g.40080  ORF Transcript_18657/g.40080 Transcript_18657/m.40080 type:complete len:830 (-) Transcript_18657:232-2721(-)|eukprot:CAMPEP_0202902240 /NCGR_PEP_ID=MMETSP1392-20130828/16739_1 /ASSEMBLY_ACC=CAM_ASM_000868 /TAXON_ID=225041 /ORGANISM="Chlamydomonas chlamydogama, Strain SAG 11-48b" /LENGTH=829 /DNA_ID=CAMNT_0049588979 /DNA_START=99 /DNA_END=2591 /DNA_ORIENTATION=+
MASTTTATTPVNNKENAPDLQELLGKGGSLPVWLSPDKFLLPDFEAEGCISDLRRYVPLATLQTELQSYLALLKSKLVEVINEDYSDYVSLSSKLVNVDGAVLRMRKPLVELKEKLSVVQEAVKAELTALNQGLKRRKEVATARSLLELLQELAHVASKVEKLLAEVAAVDSAGNVDLDSRSRLLERVGGEVSRLTFQANRGKDLAFVKSMEPRIQSYRTELEGHLNKTFVACLQQRNHAAALHCLHAYLELGDAAPAENALRTVIVAPLVAKHMADYKQQHPRAVSAAASGESLSQLLSGMLSALKTECGPVLTATLNPHGALRIFDFLGSAILEEVQSALMASMAGVFSPGVPPAFHSNYRAAMRFLDELEAMCQGRTALDRLRSSHAYSTFLKRWNLSVYFSLLYQDIAGELEDAAAMEKLETVSPAHPLGVQLPVSAALVHCLQRCTSQDVFLLQLADRYLRLAMQLGQRYGTWVQAALSARKDAQQHQAQQGPSAHPTPTLGGAAAGHSIAAGGAAGAAGASSDGGALTSNGGAASAGGAAKPVSLSWVGQLPVEDLAVLQHDVELIAGFLTSSYQPALSPLLAGLAPEVLTAVNVVITEQASSLASQAAALLACMSDEVAERCVAVVKQLKGITATYRMTTKGPPTRHSHYVTGVLVPLRTFLDSERIQKLPSTSSSGLVHTVVDNVSSRYQQLADELLTTVRKTESSLKRLKKAQNAEGAAGEVMSDSDKITLQLYLDVQEYGQQISKFGLDPSSMPSFQRLCEAVAPPKQAGGAAAQAPASAIPVSAAPASQAASEAASQAPPVPPQQSQPEAEAAGSELL